MPNTLKPVDESRSSVDGAFLPPVIINQYIVEPALCRCHRSFARHEGIDATTRIDAIHLAENSIHDEIARIPANGLTSNATSSTLLDNACAIPPSRNRLELLSSSGTSGTATNGWKEDVGRKNLKELCIHCFLSSFFPDFSERTYRHRINSLPMLIEEPFKLTRSSHHSASPSTPATQEIWPVGLEKRAYYPPLTEVLNEILEQFDLHDGDSFRFITYDRPMAPVNPQSLKPSLFLVKDKFIDLDLLRWKHPILPVEVNSNFWDGLKQLSMYTGELLSARPGRQLCWAFHFDHIGSKFRVILFTPDSIHYSQPAIITSAAGYRDMVKLVVALLSCPGLLTIGEDFSRDSRTKILPNGDKLEMLAVEFDAKPFIGRRTRIMSTVVVESGNTAMGYERPSAEDDDYVLKKMQKNAHETITFAGNRDHLEVGEHLIIKESWPFASRSNVEWSALTSCLKEFGVPEVVYKVTGKNPMPVECTQEPRVPQHIALREKGTRLQDAASPRMLLTALLHAIIGMSQIRSVTWLLISYKAIGILQERLAASGRQYWECLDVVCPCGQVVTNWGFEDLTECHGMLIDGDAMIHSTSDRKLGDHRLCTLPFLSWRLVNEWVLEMDTFDQYFDDLESFAWVLLWALIEIAQAKNGATRFDRQLIELLSGNNLLRLKAGKISIIADLKTLRGNIAEGFPKEDSTSLSHPFIVLLDQWFDLVKRKAHCGNDGTLPSSEESTLFYKDFITVAKDKLDDLPEEWNF